MSDSSSRMFVADRTGSLEVIPGSDPRNIDLGATQPIEIPMGPYLGRLTADL